MENKVYLDNAATTKLDSDVIEAMKIVMDKCYGNPSSTYSFGREAKFEIENVRKKIASILNTSPNRIIFTSGGTESNNWILFKTVENYNIDHIITSKIEHLAVLKPIEYLEKYGKVKVTFLDLDPKGHINYDQLEKTLAKNQNSKNLVSLMHANNEIGNITDIERISSICQKHNAFFHSDTAQTIGHYNFDLEKLKLDFCIGVPHKFHGPKGIGFVYLNDRIKISPLIYGGEQEFDLRSGTENVVGIVGMGKAFEKAYTDLYENKNYIENLKSYLINGLTNQISNIKFNGDCLNMNESLYTILNIQIPTTIPTDIAILKLDIKGILVSSGSACSSGTNKMSHVLKELKVLYNSANLRISLSKYNNIKELDFFIEALKSLCV